MEKNVIDLLMSVQSTNLPTQSLFFRHEKKNNNNIHSPNKLLALNIFALHILSLNFRVAHIYSNLGDSNFPIMSSLSLLDFSEVNSIRQLNIYTQ